MVSMLLYVLKNKVFIHLYLFLVTNSIVRTTLQYSSETQAESIDRYYQPGEQRQRAQHCQHDEPNYGRADRRQLAC